MRSFIRMALLLSLTSGFASSSPRPTPTPSLAARSQQYEAAHPGVLRTGGGVSEPRELAHVKPQFPETARNKKRTLSPIIAMAVITERGLVVDPTIISSAHPDLDPYVLKAIRHTTYEPARQNGKAVAVFLTYTLLFHAAP